MTAPSAHIPLAIVVAVARNGAIGRDGALPWTMPSDLARFRALTMGKPMIMGRRTFESIGRPLPGRESIVVTRRARAVFPAGVLVAASPESALAMARERAVALGAPEVALIGGAAVFEALMPDVDRIHLTLIDLAPTADTFFALPDAAIWRETSRWTPPRDPRDEAGSVHLDYIRA